MLRPIAHDILLVVVCSYDKTYGDVSSVLCSVSCLACKLIGGEPS